MLKLPEAHLNPLCELFMASVLMVYGSTGGNTEMAVDHIAGLLRERSHSVHLQRAELTVPDDLHSADVVVLASPTYGHGTLQPDMALLVDELRHLDLGGKPCAVIGLGDPKYEPQYHIESANTLEKLVQSMNGRLLLPSLRISRSPVLFLDTLIPHWAGQLASLCGGPDKN